MSANRLFRMVCLLLEHGRMTADRVAEELGISVRTVYRDVDALSAVGVPVCTSQGKGGGVYLMGGYVLDRANFTPEEQMQLLTALKELPGSDDGVVPAKLSALFRREEEDWLQVNFSRWGDSGWDSRCFLDLRRAVLERRAVHFSYASSRGRDLVCRVLPARLVFKGKSWYLQGWCSEEERFRVFRLSRMSAVTVTEQQFHRRLTPPDIDFSGEIPPMFRVDCTLRFAPNQARRVYDEFSREIIEPCEDGSLIVRAVFPEESWLYGYLLSFGSGLEILAPESLRRRVAGEARALWESHGEG